jgi:hypothetical protein
VFVCVKSVPVPHVFAAERYLVSRVGPPGHRSYRCIVRYGYRDVHQDVDSFETELVESLATFIKLDASYRCSEASLEQEEVERLTVVASNPLRDRASYDVQHSAAQSTVEMRARGPSSTEGTSSAATKKHVRFFIDSHLSSGQARGGGAGDGAGVRHGVHPGPLARAVQARVVGPQAPGRGRRLQLPAAQLPGAGRRAARAASVAARGRHGARALRLSALLARQTDL